MLQIIRRFDVEVDWPGKFVVAGGVAYNENFRGRLIPRKLANGHTNGNA